MSGKIKKNVFTVSFGASDAEVTAGTSTTALTYNIASQGTYGDAKAGSWEVMTYGYELLVKV